MVIIEDKEPFGAEIENQYYDMISRESNDVSDSERLSNTDYIDTTKYLFNRRCLYGYSIAPEDKDIEYCKALYKAVIEERCKNIKYACYRYVEAYTNRVEYVGIVNEGDLYRRHYLQHTNELWYKHGEYYFQFFQMRNRSETEAMESHLIALYGTHRYGNESKSGWGINSFIPPLHDFMWITADSNAYLAYNNYLDAIQYDGCIEEDGDDIGYPIEYYDDPLCFWSFYNNYNKLHGIECDLTNRKTIEVKKRTNNISASLDSFYSKYYHNIKSDCEYKRELFKLLYDETEKSCRKNKRALTIRDFNSIVERIKNYLEYQNNDNKTVEKQLKILQNFQ